MLHIYCIWCRSALTIGPHVQVSQIAYLLNNSEVVMDTTVVSLLWDAIDKTVVSLIFHTVDTTIVYHPHNHYVL